MRRLILINSAILVVVACCCTLAAAQSTGFTYQGSLTNTGLPANGNYDFEFRLFNALTGGTVLGTEFGFNVTVTNGVFTVPIDFGIFPNENRFMEIGVKPASGGSFTYLAPRVPVRSTPYSTNALNALNATNAANASTSENSIRLGGLPVGQFIQGGDPRLIDSRNPLPGSPSYIQNTTSPQGASNFSISGNGTAGGTLAGNIVSAATQFNLGTSRLLSSPGSTNLFAGLNAGSVSAGTNNSFFGTNAGLLSTDGGGNSFFGFEAGRGNRQGDNNSFFGRDAGRGNTIGNDGTFAGVGAGLANTNGSSNSFFGRSAGDTVTTGSNNTIIGSEADASIVGIVNATAIGSRAFVETPNSLVLGSVNSKNGAASDVNVGIGTTSPNNPLDIETELPLSSTAADVRVTSFGRFPYLSFRSSEGSRSTPVALRSGLPLLILGGDGFNGTSFTNVGMASIYFYTTENWNGSSNGTKISFLTTTNGETSPGSRMTIHDNGNVGIGSGIVNVTAAQRLDVLGNARIGPSGSIGCIEDRDGTVIAGQCSSDLRFKRDITPFGSLLNDFTKLRPVHFYWRADEFPDKQFGANQSYGLIAQEVEEIFPELVATDEKGYKTVNYAKLPLLTIQAVKELKEENDALRLQVEALRKLVCQTNAQAEICK